MDQKIFSVDWGTSNFRLRLIDVDSEKVEGAIETGEGIAPAFENWQKSGQERLDWYLAFLSQKISLLQEQVGTQPAITPLVISGMASSTLGMQELPYARLPLDESGENLQVAKLAAERPVFLIPGVCTDTDVMRGEETQWLGLMQDSRLQDLSEFLCILPGTHSKHIAVSGRKMTGFQTYMTGEFYMLLCKHSVLKTSVQTTPGLETEIDNEAFKAGVLSGVTGNLLHEAFMVRTNQLNKRFNLAQNSVYLSGMIIGAELKELKEQPVVLAGTGPLITMYREALRITDFRAQIKIITGKDFESALIKGQLAIFKQNINKHG